MTKHKAHIYTGDQRSDKGLASDTVAIGMQHREAGQEIFFFSNGRYIDYLSLTYVTNKNRILKVPL
jgi:hypothetical protein